jgi:hypothetical protein
MVNKPHIHPRSSGRTPMSWRCPSRFGVLLLLLGQIAQPWGAGLPLHAEAFTYQGRIASGGIPAAGAYEMTFRLFDAATGGQPVGPEVTLPSVQATQGLFTVQLDFGASVFDGTPRWLEISARSTASSGTFEVLSPRQAITAVPYAIRALTANGDASLLDSGILPDDRLGPAIVRTSQLLPLSNSIVDLTFAIANRSNALELLNFQVGSLSNAVVAGSNTLAGLTGVVGGLGTSLVTVSNTVVGLSNAVTGLQDSVSGLAGASTNQANQLGQILARLDGILSAVNTLSNRVGQLTAGSGGSVPTGVVLASTDPADPTLLGSGYERFASFAAGAWRAGATLDQPSARRETAAAWTGTEWILWGGILGNGTTVGSGSRYSPALDRWTSLSTINAPLPRSGHTLLWAGDRTLVWGGAGAGVTLGGQYREADGVWLQIPALDSPDNRTGHGAAWTGSRMVVWGGLDAGGLRADGGLFDPAGSAWTPLPSTGSPEARTDATLVWTGAEVLVWGGVGESGELATGGRLALAGGTTPAAWQPITLSGAPGARTAHGAVWTGSDLIVWGGRRAGGALGDGAIYHPDSDTWTAISSVGAPSARAAHQMVWTGTEVLILGGEGVGGLLSDGAAYDPATGRWRTLPTPVGGPARSGGEVAWTSTEALIFGGVGASGPLAALQRLDPTPAWHLFRKP